MQLGLTSLPLTNPRLHTVDGREVYSTVYEDSLYDEQRLQIGLPRELP